VSRQQIVLLVAADGLTRLITANGLAMYGYEVLAAKDGGEAVELLQNNRRVDVLVADADLGSDPDGLAIARFARGLHPKIDVIYTARQPFRIPDGLKVKGAPCIRTPFHPQQIVGIISELKQRASPGESDRRVA
jgi:CheY-like chemotaxis protein